MISAIIKGLTKDFKYFCKKNRGMIVYDTNLKSDVEFSLPLIVLEFNAAPDSGRLPGNGLTRMDWSFAVCVYCTAPDGYLDDDTDDSISHLDYSDLVRNYLENEVWITQTMVDVVSTYGFRITYNGTVEADSLKTKDTNLKGFKHTFETISFDQTINATFDITETAQTITGEVVFE